MPDRFATAVALVAAAVATLIMAGCQTQAGVDAGWVGKSVVQKKRTFEIVVNGEPVEPELNRIVVYRVEQVDGASILIKGQGRALTGWTAASNLVPIDEAVSFFSQQIRTDPTNGFLYAARATVYCRQNQKSDAIRDYNRAIELEPKVAAYRCARALIRQELHDHVQAIADFDEAIKLDGKSALSYVGRGVSRRQQRRMTDAIADFSEAIWLDPLAVSAYHYRGLAWCARGEYAKAVIDFDRAIRLDSQDSVTHCDRGSAWLRLNRFDRAIADFSEAIAIDPKCVRASSASPRSGRPLPRQPIEMARRPSRQRPRPAS